MAVTQVYSISAVTVGTGELSVISGTTTLQAETTPGVYQLFLDPVTNMAKADEFRVRVYETTVSGGTKRVVHQAPLMGTQSEELVTPALMLMHGWDFTIQKIAGTDRAFTASIRKA